MEFWLHPNYMLNTAYNNSFISIAQKRTDLCEVNSLLDHSIHKKVRL